MRVLTTDKAIEDLVRSTYGAAPTNRQHYVLSQALHGLVRLAKLEQQLEIKRSVERATKSQLAARSKREAQNVISKFTAHPARREKLQFDERRDN